MRGQLERGAAGKGQLFCTGLYKVSTYVRQRINLSLGRIRTKVEPVDELATEKLPLLID